MKHCNSCNIDVNTELNYCPLCFNSIEETEKENKPNLYTVSQKKPTENINKHITRKVFLLISLAAILITATINYFTKGSPWAVLVFASIVYLWIFVKHTIMSHRHIFEKITLHFLGLLGILLASNYISGGGLWFLDYVLPSLFVIVLVMLNMMLFINKKRRMWEISFLIIELIVLIISIVFINIGVCSSTILYKISMLLAILCIAGIVIMDGKNLLQELRKNMHL